MMNEKSVCPNCLRLCGWSEWKRHHRNLECRKPRRVGLESFYKDYRDDSPGWLVFLTKYAWDRICQFQKDLERQDRVVDALTTSVSNMNKRIGFLSKELNETDDKLIKANQSLFSKFLTWYRTPVKWNDFPR
jgi:hypothetical protein